MFASAWSVQNLFFLFGGGGGFGGFSGATPGKAVLGVGGGVREESNKVRSFVANGTEMTMEDDDGPGARGIVGVACKGCWRGMFFFLLLLGVFPKLNLDPKLLIDSSKGEFPFGFPLKPPWIPCF